MRRSVVVLSRLKSGLRRPVHVACETLATGLPRARTMVVAALAAPLMTGGARSEPMAAEEALESHLAFPAIDGGPASRPAGSEILNAGTLLNPSQTTSEDPYRPGSPLNALGRHPAGAPRLALIALLVGAWAAWRIARRLARRKANRPGTAARFLF